jgi:hypothetical protein
MDRRLARRLVALAAAYAVVLNTILPVLGALLLPAAVGEVGWAVICSAHGAGSASDQGGPEKPPPLCPCGGACAMPGCAAIALPDGDPAGVVAACASAAPAAPWPSGRRTEAFWPGGRKLARGPPIA